jgi:hypothetical protein
MMHVEAVNVYHCQYDWNVTNNFHSIDVNLKGIKEYPNKTALTFVKVLLF